MKKALSLLLVVLMLVGMLPMTVLNASAAAGDYELVTNVNQLSVNAKVIIAAKDSDFAMSTTQNKNNRGQTAITKSGDVLSAPSSSVQILTLEEGSTAGTYAFSTGSGYLYAASSSSNYLKTETNLSANSSWTIAIAEDGTATVTAQGSYTRNVMQYNKNSSLFACYSSASQQAIVLYVLNQGSGECDHADAEVKTVAPTCTEAGSTTINCSCGYTYTSAIAALGHSWGDWELVTAPSCTKVGAQKRACATCGETEDGEIAATDHSYTNGVCSVCGTAAPAAVATKISTAEEFVTGQYVMVVSTGYAMGTWDGSWITAVQPVTVDNSVVDAADGIWTLTVSDAGVTIQDSKGNFIAPKGGNNNGNIAGEYSWAYSLNEDGTFTFAGTDDDTVKIASNVGSDNKFRSYKNATVEANPASYPSAFTLFKMIEEGTEPEVTEPEATEPEVTEPEVTEPSVTPCPDEQHTFVDGVCTKCGETEPIGPIDPSDPTEPETSTGSYIKVTDTANLKVGDKIVIVAADSDVAMSTTQNNNNRGQIAITKDADKAVINDNVQVLTLKAGTKEGTFAFNTGSGYLYAASSSSNYLRTEEALSDNSSWTISIADGVATVVAQGTNSRNTMQYNSTSSLFACYGSASQKAISLYKFVSDSECVHTVETWTVSTPATCTENGVKTGNCTLCGEAQTATILATGHSLVYGESAIVCANGCDYSQAYTLSTIAEAKAYTDEAQVYYVKGIVTYVSGNKVYIEDSTGALLVMFNGDDAAGLALGDEILVWDCLTTYNGLIETTYTLATEYLKVSEGNTLPSQTVTLAQLTADTTNEYLAERVVIKNLTIGTINTSGDTSLTDADGNSINIYKVSGLNEAINANDVVDVTAIVSTYNGYQLLVNPGTAAADVVEVEHHDEIVIETVTIAEAKAGTAGEYYQVEGVVTYVSGRNVYIQDATGGIVVYLTANAANTKVGDKIRAYGTLATYKGLIELSGVNETNTEFYEVLSSDNSVDAQAVTIADLLADTTNEYLAEKISLTDVYVSYCSYKSSKATYTLIDGNGNTIKIYQVAVASEEECIAGGSIVNVEAVVSTYDGYQLVTTNDKITVTGTCAHETTELVNAKDATCTEAGYTGDTMCTVCQNYTARGEEIPAGHKMVTETVPPTCTEQGYDREYCSVCGGEESFENYTDPQHAYENGICTNCGAADPDAVVLPDGDATLKFSGASLTLESSLTINFKVKPAVLDAYDNVYAVFSMTHGDQVTEIIVTEETAYLYGTRYMFDFAGVAANWMNCTVTAVLYGTYNGVEYESVVAEYSVAQYCKNMLDKYSSDAAYAEFCTMLVDLVNYGSVAQMYTNFETTNLVNSFLTAEQAALGTTTMPAMDTIRDLEYVTVDNAKVRYRGAALVLDYAVVVRLTINVLEGDISNYTIKVRTERDEWIIDNATLERTSDRADGTTQYYAYFDGMYATEMREPMEVTVYEGETAVSNTLLYSIESYAGDNYEKASATPYLQELLVAMLRYGDSAEKYMS